MLTEKYNHKEIEKKWQNYWHEKKIYTWKNDLPREQTFVIDTPPPTVSGLLHMGHVFSYTQADFVARFQRMSGKDVFYPMGFDDNGLPTERLVEKEKGIRAVTMARDAFIAQCREVVDMAEKEFEALFNAIALSVDWEQKYQTISPSSQQLSQASFVDLWKKGLVERKFEPVFWDVADRTALAQADLVDKEVASSMNEIEFEIEDSSTRIDNGTPYIILGENDGEKIVIMTTRPELLPACVAVMINSSHTDENGKKKWAHLIKNPLDENGEGFTGSYANTALFGMKVPIIADNDVKVDKGTGAVMCCTFGDETDIKWWKKYALALKIIINKEGRTDWAALCNISGANQEIIKEFHGEEKGRTTKQAREWIITKLKEQNLLLKEESFTHAVKCAERSGMAIEILVAPQWFIKILDKKEELKRKAQECNWFPEYMRVRIEQWIDGLSWDWCISRQRFFGVPFPVWRVRENNDPATEKTIVADFAELPVDPLKSGPKGYENYKAIEDYKAIGQYYYTATKDGENYTIFPETDILDTWATSSISPQLSSGAINEDMLRELLNAGAIDAKTFDEKLARHNKLFPADMRPQAHEIIRTWAFYTIAKAYLHNNFSTNSTSVASNSSDKINISDSVFSGATKNSIAENSSTEPRDIPWKNLMISGWCLAADKTKMSKSKGNIVTPTALVEEKSSDIVRYFASTSHLGADTAFSEDVFKIGHKLVTKLFNAAKFVAINFEVLKEAKALQNAKADSHQPQSASSPAHQGSCNSAKNLVESKTIFCAADLWILSKLHQTLSQATSSFEKFEYARAREKIEEFFWHDFCDNYLEIVKVRAYGLKAEKLNDRELSDAEKQKIIAQQLSGVHTLHICLNTLLKLFAPFIPHVTEEIYANIFAEESESFAKESRQAASIHARGNWPKLEDFFFEQKFHDIGEAALEVIFEVRKFKSDNNLSMKTAVKKLAIQNPLDLSEILEDLGNVCNAVEPQFSKNEASVVIEV